MLGDYRKIYENAASLISGWQNLSKNDLVAGYIKYEKVDNDLAAAYLSALICKYWGTISKMYSHSYKSVSVDECYHWLINGILYALKHRKWLDPENKLYGDPNGPDKVINRCIISSRKIFYQWSNYDCRRGNYNAASMNQLVEDLGDSSLSLMGDRGYVELDDMDAELKGIVVKAFQERNYFLAFMLDAIMYFDAFDREREADGYIYTRLSEKKLVKHFHHLDEAYCKLFSERFNLNLEDVRRAARICGELSLVEVHNRISSNLKEMRANKHKYLED